MIKNTHPEAELEPKAMGHAVVASPASSQEIGTVSTSWQEALAELKYAFTTKDGWIGDYV